MRPSAFVGSFPIALICSLAWGGETVTGRPVVIDGDTLRLHGSVIGLFGVAAPGINQTCENAAGRSVPCGQNAARALAARIGEAPVTCEPRGVDRHRRAVAVCRVHDEDLGAWLVGKGLAVADRQSAPDYIALDKKAWATRRGLWAGVFEDPSSRRRDELALTAQVSALAR